MSKANKRERQRMNREARREYEQALARRRRTMKTARTFAILAVPVIAIGIVLSVTSGSSTTPNPGVQYAALTTTLGEIDVRLDGSEAPKSEAEFLRLANRGAYDGLKIIRASSSVGVIQSGEPKGNKSLADEFPKSSFKLGDFVLTSAGAPNTNALSFFIVTGQPATQLPRKFNRFGHVIRGLDIAQEIQGLAPSSGDGPPLEGVTITSVVITKKRPGVPPTVTTTASPPST